MTASALPPTGLLCQLLASPELTVIHAARPRFGWIVADRRAGALQTAYHLQVATNLALLERDRPDLWDSGLVESDQSQAVRYAGGKLRPETAYCWRVRTWNDRGEASPWSTPQTFRTGPSTQENTTEQYPLQQSAVAPVTCVETGPGRLFLDFGRAAFGTLRLTVECPEPGGRLVAHLGERLAAPQTVDTQPPGCIRYRRVEQPLQPGRHTYTLRIPPDPRNTGPEAVPMPEQIGEVVPFRYAELEGLSPPAALVRVHQLIAHYPFDDQATAFSCSDEILNAVWELCRYSIKATSFCGVYVDGDRERIPYEGDAYVNQLSHYAVDREFSLARHTHEYLLRRPTWPTEWQLCSVLIAWNDYLYTGDPDSLTRCWDDLRAKSLLALAREDGLISAARATPEVLASLHLEGELKDIIDWPPGSFTEGGTGERDGYELVPCNTVVNAYHARALELLARIALVLARPEEAAQLRARQARVRQAIDDLFFDAERGVYIDGEGSTHASLHANIFPLAFGLVPPARRSRVVEFICSRGMACSVYGAQFLLEGLYRAGAAEQALALMTARHDRSWWNMIQAGSTVTLEAWDWRYKNNLDWNHAWGAAPVNIVSRYLLGVRPLAPGFSRILVQPQLAGLTEAQGRVPTIRGPVSVAVRQQPDRFTLDIELPANTTARVVLPVPIATGTLTLDGDPVLIGPIDPVGSGRHLVEWQG
ncbi:MAG: alpha-L-rhamnosidase C-terminal domain-containing protein [Candidatus Latescibacterota bacterium]|jgi:hypothetical protein